MTRVARVDSAGVGRSRGRGRRAAWIVSVFLVLVAGVAAWQVAARTARVEPGSFYSTGTGARLPDCVPGDAIWAMFGTDEGVVLAQAVRNPSPWPVTVSSTDPHVFRFEPIAEDELDDVVLVNDPLDGEPDRSQTSARVVIPPGREAALWIVDPQRERTISSGWMMFDVAELKLRALGVERRFSLPLAGTIAVGGADLTTRQLGRDLQEACDA
ncbi:hypothetical protein [Promicromonospora sukumoe]